MTIWVLVVVFVHHGLLIDTQQLHIDRRFSTKEACLTRQSEIISAYKTAEIATCIEIKPLKEPS